MVHVQIDAATRRYREFRARFGDSEITLTRMDRSNSYMRKRSHSLELVVGENGAVSDRLRGDGDAGRGATEGVKFHFAPEPVIQIFGGRNVPPLEMKASATHVCIQEGVASGDLNLRDFLCLR